MLKSYYQDYYHWSESHWWFLGRKKILSELWPLFVNKHEPKMILNIGCSDRLSEIFQSIPQKQWVDVDIHYESIQHALKEPHRIGIQADCYKLPFKNTLFDIIFICDVLEHLKDDTILEKLAPLCKKDGIIIITVPAFSWLWGRQDKISGHYRRYTKKTLKNIIPKSYLEIKKISYFNTILFPLIALYRFFSRFQTSHALVSDFTVNNNSLFNRIFFRVFEFEKYILRFMDLRFGVSLLCFCQKK